MKKTNFTKAQKLTQNKNIIDRIYKLEEGQTLILESEWNGAYTILIHIETDGEYYSYRKDRIGARGDITKQLGMDSHIPYETPKVLLDKMWKLGTKYNISLESPQR